MSIMMALVAARGSGAVLQQTVPDQPALIAHWTFDGDALDSVGTTHGTLVGSPTFDGVAQVGGGIRLSGAGGTPGQYVDFGDAADFLGVGRSYAGWWHPESQVTTRAIFAKISTNGQSGIMLWQNGLTVQAFIDSPTAQVSAANFAVLQQWAHIALVLDNTVSPFTARLYKDGVQVATGTYSTVTNPTQPFLIGRQPGFSNRDFDGVLDDWRVYNYPLSQAEIAALVAMGQPPLQLETINGSAVQVAVSVGSTARQTFDGFGWGAGGPTDVPNLTSLVSDEPNHTRLFSDLNTKVMRLVDPLFPNFIGIHKPLVNIAVAAGVDRIMALGFVKSGGYTATELADAVDAAMDAGIPITHVNIQNEPDGGVGENAMTGAEITAHVIELRARLNALGRSAVKITGCEWAKFSQVASPSLIDEYDNGFALEPAGFIGPTGTITRGAGHCYRGCPTHEDYDNRYATKGVGLWSGETGNGGVPHTGARFIAGLNHGVEVEVHHGGQTPPNLPGNIQCLVEPDGTTMPHWGQYRVITPLLTRGSRARLCTCNDGVTNTLVTPNVASNGASLPELSTISKQRMLRTFDTQKPRINVAVLKRPDNRWVIAACNTTLDPPETSNFASAHYGAALIQITATIPELSGVTRVWTAQRCNSAGTVTTGANINMVNGQIRFTLQAAETIGLLSS